MAMGSSNSSSIVLARWAATAGGGGLRVHPAVLRPTDAAGVRQGDVVAGVCPHQRQR